MNSVKHSLLLFNVAACSAVIGLLSVIIIIILSQRAALTHSANYRYSYYYAAERHA